MDGSEDGLESRWEGLENNYQMSKTIVLPADVLYSAGAVQPATNKTRDSGLRRQPILYGSFSFIGMRKNLSLHESLFLYVGISHFQHHAN